MPTECDGGMYCETYELHLPTGTTYAATFKINIFLKVEIFAYIFSSSPVITKYQLVMQFLVWFDFVKFKFLHVKQR